MSRGRTSFGELAPQLADGGDADIEEPVLSISLVPHSVHPLGGLPHRIGVSLRGHGLSDRLLELRFQLRGDGRWSLMMGHRLFLPGDSKRDQDERRAENSNVRTRWANRSLGLRSWMSSPPGHPARGDRLLERLHG